MPCRDLCGPETGAAYYYNNWTGETAWEAPAGYYGYDGNYYGTYENQDAYYATGGVAVTEATQQWAAWAAEQQTAQPPQPPAGGVSTAMKGWELTVDQTSEDGAVYYTDLATGVTQWEMPAEMDALHFLENVTELNVSHNRLSAIAPVSASSQSCARVFGNTVGPCPSARASASVVLSGERWCVRAYMSWAM